GARGGELAVAVERAREVAAHRLARGSGVAGVDRFINAAVLFLDEREVGAPADLLGEAAHRASRYQVPADELQEAHEFRIAGGAGDRAVQAEVLVDRGPALLGGALERLARR